MFAAVGISQYTHYGSKQIEFKKSVFRVGHVMRLGQATKSRYQKSQKRTPEIFGNRICL